MSKPPTPHLAPTFESLDAATNTQNSAVCSDTFNGSAVDIVRQHLQAPAATQIDKAEYAQAAAIIKPLLAREDAVLVAHYYTSPAIQLLAEQTGGIVSDSLEMARYGAKHKATTLMVAGVKFMGETAKILSPSKRVLMPTLEATCSLDLGCPINEFAKFCDQHPDRTVVVYANTSAAVKARADWVVTSSIALEVVDYLDANGEKIIWAPDKHLGSYIQKQTGADMLMWDSACIVHDEFKAKGILDLKAVYPNAAVLAHPESPASVLALADRVGSTTQIIQAATELLNKQLIVATDQGIFYKLCQAAPDKEVLIAPTGGESATCRSCANCPWMAMNELDNLAAGLANGGNEIIVDGELAKRATTPLQRMLDFKNNPVMA